MTFTHLSRMQLRHFFLGLLLVMAAACTRERMTEPPVPDTEAVLLLDFNFPHSPASAPAPALRAAIGETDETTIHSVDVLSFLVDPADPTNIQKGTFFYHASGQYDPVTNKVKVMLNVYPQGQTLVVLANVHSQVMALHAHTGEDKEAVMSRLRVPAVMSSIPPLDPNGQPWDGGMMQSAFTVTNGMIPDFTGGMPMWGELPNQVIDRNYAATPRTVTLIRPVAKVTIKSAPEIEPIADIRLFNPRTDGRMSPDNLDASNLLQPKVFTPTVPTGATPASGSSITCDMRHGMYSYTSWSYYNQDFSFYIFESDSKSKSQGDVTGLVVGGQYMGHGGVQSFGYYRIDFKDYATGTKMDILRNHHYVITMPSTATVAPAATPEEAWRGNHVLHAKIEDWNLVDEQVKIKPKMARVAVDKRDILFFAKKGEEQTLTITTEGTGGWKLTNIPNWITVVGDTEKNTDGTSTIRLKVKATNHLFPRQDIILATNSGPREVQMPIHLFYYNSLHPLESIIVGHKRTVEDPDIQYNRLSHFYFVRELGGLFPKKTLNMQETQNAETINDQFFIGGRSIYNTKTQIWHEAGRDKVYMLRFMGKGYYEITSPVFFSENLFLSAYRYTRVGDFTLNSNSKWVVESIHLGPNFTGTLQDISDDAWWERQIRECHPVDYVKRMIDMDGAIEYSKYNYYNQYQGSVLYNVGMNAFIGVYRDKPHYDYKYSSYSSGIKFSKDKIEVTQQQWSGSWSGDYIKAKIHITSHPNGGSARAHMCP